MGGSLIRTDDKTSKTIYKSTPSSDSLNNNPDGFDRDIFKNPASNIPNKRHIINESGEFRLLSPGYRGYEKYLATVHPDKIPWMKMNDIAGEVHEIERETNYSVYCLKRGKREDDKGQGLLLTDIDLDKINGLTLKKLSDWRIRKAAVQRAYYLSLCNSRERFKHIKSLESKYSLRRLDKKKLLFPFFEKFSKLKNPNGNKTFQLEDLERLLEYAFCDYKDFGYHARFSAEKSSRSKLVQKGIYHKIGKFVRSIIVLSPMPDSSGSVDAITTSAMCHMLAIIPRNFKFSALNYQVDFAKSVLERIDSFPIPKNLLDIEADMKKYWKQNICAAIGSQKTDFDRFKLLYEAGIRSFRIYSIATDTRIRIITKKITSFLVENEIKDVEMFVGQITSIEQFENLHKTLGDDKWGKIHGFFIGNGGGSRCKTAETGMVVNSPNLSYQLRNNRYLENKSIIIEGGVSTEPAAALLLGADGLSYSAGIMGGCIESPGGALFIYSPRKGEYWKPYRGEASPSAKILENITYETGDARQVEGSNGFVRTEKKYPSMCGRIWIINEWLAQSFVKLGVKDCYQLSFLGTMLDKSETQKIFESPPVDIPDIVKVICKGKVKYIIPLPLFKRTQAQKRVASSHGLIGEIKIEDVKDVDYAIRIPNK